MAATFIRHFLLRPPPIPALIPTGNAPYHLGHASGLHTCTDLSLYLRNGRRSSQHSRSLSFHGILLQRLPSKNTLPFQATSSLLPRLCPAMEAMSALPRRHSHLLRLPQSSRMRATPHHLIRPNRLFYSNSTRHRHFSKASP
jgi:hypothetical protein